MASTTTEEKEHPNTKATAPSLGFIKFNLILLNFFAAGIFCALVAIAAKLYAKGGSARGLQPAQVRWISSARCLASILPLVLLG